MEITVAAIVAALLLAVAAAGAAVVRSSLLILGEDGLSDAASKGSAIARALLDAVRDPARRHPFALFAAQAGLKSVAGMLAGAGALGLAGEGGGAAGVAAAAAWVILFLLILFALENLAGRKAMDGPDAILRGGKCALFALRAAAGPARALDRLGRLAFGERYSPEAIMDVRFGSEQGILDVIEEGAEHGTIGATEERMMEGVLRFGEMAVSEVMTPWSRVVSLREGMDPAEIGRVAGESGFSRYPVLSAGGEQVVGILAVGVLLGAEKPFRLESCLAKPVYVPESMKVSDLFRQFRRAGVPLAVVIDEHGKLCGVVTPLDLMARIAGGLDEGNGAREAPEWEKDGGLSVPGATPVRVLRDEYGIRIPLSDHYETVAGFAVDRLQHLPEGRVTFLAEGYRITVSEIERYRVRRLRFEKAGTPTGTS